MLSCFAPLFMVAALGQAPDQSAWLKSVPVDTAIVVRVKALETVRDDLIKMLEGMSGNAVALARPQIEQGLEMMKAQSGAHSVQHPFFMLITLPKDGPMPGWAAMVESDNYEAVIREVTKKQDFKSNPKDGVDTFDGPDGQPWYSAKGTGFVTFGADQGLVKGTLKPSASLDSKITPEIKKEFLGGDLGLYVNIAAVQGQYGDQIEGAKQQLIGLLDQAGGQANAKGMEAAKAMYVGMFDSIKVADTLALSFNFAGAGLTSSGALTLKADSDAAKMLASAKTGTGAGLSKLPGEGFAYSYINASPEWMKSMSKLGLSMLSGGGKPTAELQKAEDLQIAAGATETYQAMSSGAGGFGGMASVAFTTPKDPAKAVEAATLMSQALKTPGGMFKDIVVTPKVETYKGFAMNAAKMTFDFEKMAPPNAPGGAEGMKKLMGGDSMTSWFGTDGKTFLTVSGKSAEEAKAKIDAFVSGQGSLGKSPAYEAVRSELPQDVTFLMLINVQGMVRFVAQTVGSMSGAVPAVPADMPKETALFGGAVAATPKGYQFKFVVPSNVGPVIEKGLIPMMQGIGGVIQ